MGQAVAEDEVDLLSAWTAIVRRKHVVIAVFLLGLLGGLWLAWVDEPVYESRAVLQIGRVGGVGRIQDTDALVQTLSQAHRIGDSSERDRRTPYLAGVDEIADGTVLMTARALTAEESRAFLRGEVVKILADHAGIFEDAASRKKRAREALVGLIASLGNQARVLEERVPSAALAQERFRVTAELSDLEERLQRLESELSRISTSPTTLLHEPTLPEQAMGRGKLFFALAGAAAGLILGIALALMLDALLRRETAR